MQVRGDIARSVLYMALRYGFNQPLGSHNLQVSDSPSMGKPFVHVKLLSKQNM
jgi:endonuclease I